MATTLLQLVMLQTTLGIFLKSDFIFCAQRLKYEGGWGRFCHGNNTLATCHAKDNSRHFFKNSDFNFCAQRLKYEGGWWRFCHGNNTLATCHAKDNSRHFFKNSDFNFCAQRLKYEGGLVDVLQWQQHSCNLSCYRQLSAFF